MMKPFARSCLGRWRLPAAALFGLAVFACGGTDAADEQLTVFAAASCADWVQELPGREGLRLQFGPSSGLARQIADGAPADVFITAHRSWIDYLIERERVAGEPISFAQNSLVCIALESAEFVGDAPTDLARLASALLSDDRIAIADESVPAGDYARQALGHAAQLEALRTHFVGQDDARSTLRAVTQGQAKIGFVYASDAAGEGLRILFTMNPASHDAIQYWACAVRSNREPGEAEAFLTGLSLTETQVLLQRHGFQVENAPALAPQHQ